MMIIIAALFTASAVISLVMFKKVHGLYRTTGASFEKAQQEFATGVMSNKTVQTAAANAASTAATSAAQNAFKVIISTYFLNQISQFKIFRVYNLTENLSHQYALLSVDFTNIQNINHKIQQKEYKIMNINGETVGGEKLWTNL
eukprot:bmy_04645T0